MRDSTMREQLWRRQPVGAVEDQAVEKNPREPFIKDRVGVSSKRTMLGKGGVSKKSVFARTSLMDDP